MLIPTFFSTSVDDFMAKQTGEVGCGEWQVLTPRKRAFRNCLHEFDPGPQSCGRGLQKF